MKTKLFYSLCVLFLAVLLTSCGGSGSTPPSSSTPTPMATPASTPTPTPAPTPAPTPTPVPDTMAPVITLGGDTSVILNIGDTFADSGATCTDNVDTSCLVVVGGAVDTSVAGVYMLTYNATDSAGNAAAQVVRTFTVNMVVSSNMFTIPDYNLTTDRAPDNPANALRCNGSSEHYMVNNPYASRGVTEICANIGTLSDQDGNALDVIYITALRLMSGTTIGLTNIIGIAPGQMVEVDRTYQLSGTINGSGFNDPLTITNASEAGFRSITEFQDDPVIFFNAEGNVRLIMDIDATDDSRHVFSFEEI